MNRLFLMLLVSCFVGCISEPDPPVSYQIEMIKDGAILQTYTNFANEDIELIDFPKDGITWRVTPIYVDYYIHGTYTNMKSNPEDLYDQ